LLRQHLEQEIATELEREARLVAAFAPADSTRWPEFAAWPARGSAPRHADRSGRHVRGDTEFDRASLAQRRITATVRVRAALDSARGVGMNERLSASTNERQMYVAIRAARPARRGARSTTLAIVDARCMPSARRRMAGLVMLLAAWLLAWMLARALAWPLLRIAEAARDIAAGRQAEFPDVRSPSLPTTSMRCARASRARAPLRRLAPRARGIRTLLEALSDGVLAADKRGIIIETNAAARRLLGYGDTEPLPPLGELFHDRAHAR